MKTRSWVKKDKYPIVLVCFTFFLFSRGKTRIPNDEKKDSDSRIVDLRDIMDAFRVIKKKPEKLRKMKVHSFLSIPDILIVTFENSVSDDQCPK
jgi:hypothetical protein